MKVFVINMAKDVRRRQDMTRQLDRLGLDYEFFEAIDGKKIDESLLLEIANKDSLEETQKRPIEELRGMIGGTYSNYLVYQRMMKEDIQRACILEDDIILSSDFKEYLDYIEGEIGENEIVSFHTLLFSEISLNPTGRTYKECELMTPVPAAVRGAQGYVVTKHCASQLMKEMIPIKDFPDCFNRYHLFCPDVQIRVLYPFVMRHMWINSVRDDKLYGLKDRLINYCQNKRLFPFWNFIRRRRRLVNDNYIQGFITNQQGSMYVSELQKDSFWAKL